MPICNKCGKVILDDSKFCDNCGSELNKNIFCTNCGFEYDPVFEICPNCGNQTDFQSTKVQKKLKYNKKSITKIIIATVAIILVCTICVGVVKTIINSKDSKVNLMYLKNDIAFYSNLSSDEPIKITTNMSYSDTYVDSDYNQLSRYESYEYTLSKSVYISEDKSVIFYPDKTDLYSDKSFSLYYKFLNSKEIETEKVDDSVYTYTVSKDNNIVTYTKGDVKSQLDLYQYNIKTTEKEKISADISTFYVSDDGNTIYYFTSQSDLYYKQNGKDKVKLDSDISTADYISEDFKTVVYSVKDGDEYDVYKISNFKDKEKVISNCYYKMNISKDGEMIYLKKNESVISDLIIDDELTSDLAMQKPMMPTMGSYTNDDEFKKALENYNVEYAQYKADIEKYNQKLIRDEIRNDLKENNDFGLYELYYFDGKNEFLVDSNCYNIPDYPYSESQFCIYDKFDVDKCHTVSLSDFTNSKDLKDKLQSNISNTTSKYIALKNESFEFQEHGSDNIDLEKISDDFYITSDYSTLFLTQINDENDFDLYRVAISSNGLESSTLVDTGVGIFSLLDDDLYYLKNRRIYDLHSVYDFYDEHGLIDYEVYVDSLKRTSNNKLYYLTDWNDKKCMGTLKLYESDGQKKKIADDVYSFEIIDGNSVAYIKDYTLTSNEGDLYYWKNDKSEKIESDVNFILNCYSMKENYNLKYYGGAQYGKLW